MSLKNAAFPASEAFDAINASLQSDEAERKNAIKMGQSVFAFTLKNKAGETDSWHIDLKKDGVVAKGLGDKPTVTLSLSDEDFGKLVAGKANAQKLFMSGKLKVKGDVMKATKMEPILKRAQTKAKLLQEYDSKRSPLTSPSTRSASTAPTTPPHPAHQTTYLSLLIFPEPFIVCASPSPAVYQSLVTTIPSTPPTPHGVGNSIDQLPPISLGGFFHVHTPPRLSTKLPYCTVDERERGDDDCVRGYGAAERVPEVPY
ncbi:hypothetical protein V497_02200 [Pseudogymnoascus sp. VKM F-4516 (FW-969)]|nr:hypothetical protein V497_02200 [Pseudogymnoascus sp. VKM F-4516 (FW-969)]